VERAIQWGTVVWVAWMCFSAARAYAALPPRIPIHFDLFGRPDGWGPRGMIFLLPGIAVLLLALWSAIGMGGDSLSAQEAGRLARRPLPPAQRPAFHLLLLVIVVAFSYVNRQMIEISAGRASTLDKYFLPVFLFALGGVILWMVRASSP